MNNLSGIQSGGVHLGSTVSTQSTDSKSFSVSSLKDLGKTAIAGLEKAASKALSAAFFGVSGAAASCLSVGVALGGVFTAGLLCLAGEKKEASEMMNKSLNLTIDTVKETCRLVFNTIMDLPINS